MKIAFVYDRVNKWGGAERVLMALHEIWPDAPLFTSVYDKKRASWADVFRVIPTFLNNFPLAKSHHEIYPWLTTLAFECLNFDDYDIVISVTSAEAKSIITKPKTLHICYCLTPIRYLWSGYQDYQNNPGFDRLSMPVSAFHKILLKTLRRWDLYSSNRPDKYLAISNRIQKRLEQYYKKKVEKIIYPPVDTNLFNLSEIASRNMGYFLVVARFVGYKRIDLIIKAFNKLGWPLVIIGTGRQRQELVKIAKSNIRFVGGNLTDSEVVRYYQNCRALIHAADEDFGICALEAQSCGKPVISFKNSGVNEIIKDGITGLFFAEQNEQSIINTLKRFEEINIQYTDCRNNALSFDKVAFKNNFKKTVEEIYRRYKKI